MEQKNYKNKFTFIQQSLDGREYDVVIKESATLFEVAMKQIFHQAITKLPFAEKKELFKAEDEIGKGNKGVDDFTFGQLVGLYRQSKLFKKWETISDVDLGILTSLDLGSIVEMRNKLTHQGASCNKFEAELVFNYLKNFFATLGLADIEEAVEKVIEQTKISKHETKATDEFDIKLLKKSSKTLLYSPIGYDELDRLRKQSKRREKIDLDGLKYALSLMDKKNNLIGLDIGCAEGFVTYERFSKLNGFSHVVGIDQSNDAIQKANDANYENYSFYNADIETKDGVKVLKDRLSELGKDGFDVIFSAAVFHHLKNPTKVLRELRKLLNKNGTIIIVTYDDKFIVSYPDPKNLVENLQLRRKKIPGISNRQHGRQIYTEMSISGFKNPKIILNAISTSGMTIDDRLDVFHTSFSWTSNSIKRAIVKYPEQKNQLERDLLWIESAVEEIEDMFGSDDYFYMLPILVAVGQKV